MNRTEQSGFTLLELMITVVVLGIVVAMAIPAFGDMFERQRINGAARDMYGFLLYARNEAIKKSTDIRVTITQNEAGEWFVGMTDKAAACNPTLTAAADNDASCTINQDMAGTADLTLARMTHADYPGVILPGGATATLNFTFTSQGIVNDSDGAPKSITLPTLTTERSGLEKELTVTVIGRVCFACAEES